TIIAVHCTTRGPSLGGCRMWSYEDARAAVRDALRLSRAMTYKAAVADLPLGGGKGGIVLPARAKFAASPRAAARLAVADVDERKRALATQLDARWLSPDQALRADVDVLVPCALGRMLNDQTVPALNCRVIAGAANNQLATERIAEQLASRSILWAPDFVANSGGLINIAEELDGYDPATARRRVRRIGDTVREIFDRAAAASETPLAGAMALAELRIAEAATGTGVETIATGIGTDTKRDPRA